MSEQSPRNYPLPSLSRLPVYLRFLKELQENDQKVVSCTQIAEEFGQLSVQVRKDLALTGISGRPKVGYNINELIRKIEAFLGWDKRLTAFLIGSGSLGSAILGYRGFVEHGLAIVGSFDSDPAKIGSMIHGHEIFPVSKILEMGERQNVDIGILTVPASFAQSMADLLIQIGVRGIWNYTPCRLELPPGIICEDVKLSASFAVLSNRLLHQQRDQISPY